MMSISDKIKKLEEYLENNKLSEKKDKVVEVATKATLKTKSTAAHIFGIAKAMGEAARNYEPPKK
jgi:hypothetical protein